MIKENTFIKILVINLLIIVISICSYAQQNTDYISKGAKVYIESNDNNVMVHSKDKILLWGYWKPVESKTEADFILTLDANFSVFYTIYAQAITKDNKIIKKFKSKNSFNGLDVNPKRGAVRALFDTEIIPFIHGMN